MSGGASFGGPSTPAVPLTGGLPGAIGAPVDNAGLTNSAILLLIEAWNTNTNALVNLLSHVGGTITGDVTGTLPGPVQVIATHLAAPLPIGQGGTGNALGQASPIGPAAGDLGDSYPDPIVTNTHLLAPLPVGQGGSGITSGTSGGILGFTAIGVVGSSGLLAADQLVVGGGAGVLPSTLGSLGTTTTLLHGNAAGLPSFGQVVTGDIAASAVTYAKIQNESAGTLLGNVGGSPAPPSEVSLGLTFGFVGGTELVTAAITGDVTASANSFSTTVGKIAGVAVAPAAWVPSDASGAGLVFTSVSANKTQLGNMVSAYATLTYPATVDGSNAIIGGLPVNAANHPYAQMPAAIYPSGGTLALLLVPIPNTNTAKIVNHATGAAITNATLSTLTLSFGLIYPVA